MSATATTRHPAAAPRLALLLLVSLLLHLLLLWAVHSAAPARERPGPLHVSLVDSRTTPAATTTAIAPPLSAPPQARAPSVSATVQPGAESGPDESELLEWPGGTSERVLYDMGLSAEYTAATHSAAEGEAIRARIYSRFAEHFHYPPLAQRRNWQGTVVLSFRVEADGTIDFIEVAESSGYDLLDKAAIESLRAIGRIEFAPGTALQQTLELRLPVVYHLAQR